MRKYNWLKCAIILGVVPGLIFIGTRYFSGKSYYMICTLILLALIFPFGLEYAAHKPSTKKMVLVASLSAIATIGRVAFYMIPQFKPVLAIVIISAVIIGPYEGFIVGALTGFLSNFYFGQGPWTVWQMFCFGFVGFLGGYLFRKIKVSRISLSVYGLVSAIVIYGGIINFGSLVMTSSAITKGSILAIYISGFPYDCVHGIATYVFLFVIYRPFMEKLTRIKIKYDII